MYIIGLDNNEKHVLFTLTHGQAQLVIVSDFSQNAMRVFKLKDHVPPDCLREFEDSQGVKIKSFNYLGHEVPLGSEQEYYSEYHLEITPAEAISLLQEVIRTELSVSLLPL